MTSAPPASGTRVPGPYSKPPPSVRLASTALRGLVRLFREHTTMALTLGYLFLTVLGATYEFFMLMTFRINVLQYADPADFLFAVVRQPIVILFTALPIALLGVIDLINKGLSRLVPRYHRYLEAQRADPRYEVLTHASQVAFVVVYFAAFTIYYAQYVADQLRAGEGRPVRVALQTAGVGGVTQLDGILLGTTSRYVFVYQRSDSTAHVVPTESVSDMTVHRRPRRGR